jgi:hypothetical protein
VVKMPDIIKDANMIIDIEVFKFLAWKQAEILDYIKFWVAEADLQIMFYVLGA